MKIIIMAGGGGTRLWPLSREAQPKQFCRIIGDRTMFEETVSRFTDEFSYSDIYVCLNEQLAPLARELAPQIPAENYIIEPEKRDTAPAMGFAAVTLFQLFPDEPIAFVPSDHYIGDKNKFIRSILKAEKIIRQTGQMLDIAITPTFPSTVLGYTKIGKTLEEENGVTVCEFLGHTEKPAFESAKKYLAAGDYLWHASYYMWTPRRILDAFAKHSPEHYQLLIEIGDALTAGDHSRVSASFQQMPMISFDYAITEKIDPAQVAIIKGDFGWSDVGAFDVLYEAQRQAVDERGNLHFGSFWSKDDTSNCLVYNKEDKLIATLGVDDLVIVNTPDVLLICPKGRAQDVKRIVNKAKSENREKFL